MILRLGIISRIERFQRFLSLTEDSSGWTSSTVLFLLPGICASSAAVVLVSMWAVSEDGFHCDSLAFLVGRIPNLHSQWEQVDGGWRCMRLCGGEKEWDNHWEHHVSADRDSQLSFFNGKKNQTSSILDAVPQEVFWPLTPGPPRACRLYLTFHLWSPPSGPFPTNRRF